MKFKKKESLDEKSRLYFLVSLSFVLFISLVLIENKTLYTLEEKVSIQLYDVAELDEEPQLTQFQKEKPQLKKKKQLSLDQIPEKDLEDFNEEPDVIEFDDIIQTPNDENTITPDDIDDLPKTEIIEKVPYNRVSKAPIFSGCEVMPTNEEQKKCMNQKIASIVTKKLRPDLNINEEDVQIYIQFTVNEFGHVIDVKANSKSKFLNHQAKTIIENLPQFTPAQHNSQKVQVVYSLPIFVKVN